MALTPAQRETAKKLFDSALDCQTEIRSVFLHETCQDPHVCDEVERLLAQHAEMGSFLKDVGPASNGSCSSPPKPTFSDGDTLAGRFRIIRFIAHGGMGEVYEAEDLEFCQPVAIKTIRSDLLQTSFLDQFKNEVQLAKQVTHPNVCRIYDLYRHSPLRPNAESDNDTFFVSMELLRGETLAEHLRGRSRLTPEEAFPIIDQIASALEAAHAAGILHRDLKPENIMLVPTGPQGSVRAVVTDFGLALQTKEGHAPTASASPGGTPAYMSPEQLRGDPLTPSSDVYSLGLLMYRIVAGVRAFERDGPTLFGVRRLTEKPQSPREIVRDLDPAWNTAILNCLEHDARQRPQTVRQAMQALRGEKSFIKTSRGRMTLALVAVLLISLSVPIFESRLHNQQGALKPRPRIAVLGFKNTSAGQDTAWISTALSIFLTARLSAGDKLDTIPEEDIARMKTDLTLSDSDRLSNATLAKIRSRFGADLVILGSYQKDSAKAQFDVRVLDAATGATRNSLKEVGNPAALLALFIRVGDRLRSTLRLRPPTQHEDEEALSALPSNLEAFRLYTSGVDKLDQFDPLTAREQLLQAVQVEPEFPLAHSALAEAWSALGYDEKAATAAKAAFDLSGRLSWRDRQLIEGRYREMSKQWGLAGEIYRRLWSAYPREVDYGLRLASVQTSAGNTDKAMATVERLRAALSTGRDDPRIDYAEVLAQDNTRAKQVAAARAAAKAEATGQRQLLAAARRDESRCLLSMGRRKEALEALNQSKNIYASLGDRAHVAYVTLNLATALNGQVSLSARRAMIEESLQTFRSVGCEEGEGSALNNLAGVLEDAGDLNQALKTYQRAMDVYAQIGNRYRIINTLNNIGTVLQTQGDLAGALKEYQQSLTLWKMLNNRDNATFVRWNIADVLREMGRLTDSSKMYDEILAVERQSGTETGIAGALHGKGDVLAAQGHLAIARRAYEQAEEITRRLGSVPTIATLLHKLAALQMDQGNFPAAHRLIQEARQMLERAGQVGEQNDMGASHRIVDARLQLEEGRAESAEPLTRSAIQQFHEHHSFPDEMSGRIVLARCLLAQSKIAESQIELNQVEAFLKKSPIQLIRLDYLITAARTKAASGAAANIADARRTLQKALNESQAQGFAGENLEARLVEAEIANEAGNPDAPSHLVSLEADATKNGFGLIAQKAMRLALNAKQ